MIKQRNDETKRDMERDALSLWLRQYHWDVMGMLDFRTEVTDRAARKALNYYWNKVDRTFFGNRVQRANERIQRFVFLHKGRYGINPHFHFVALSPNDNPEQFALFLRKYWQTGLIESGNQGRFEKVEDKEAVSHYLTHEYGHLGNETLEVFSSHIRANTDCRVKYKDRARLDLIRRLLKDSIA